MAQMAIDTAGARAPAGAGTDRRLSTDMEASARALVAADDAHVRAAMNSVRWERRGVLQRLVRSGHTGPVSGGR
jgi:hypothetical protein